MTILSRIQADDKIPSVTCPALPAGGLLPTQSQTCTASYAVTQADIDAGSVTNIASATDGTLTSPEVSVTVNGAQSSTITLLKTASTTTFSASGDTIDYEYVVTNSGNVTLTQAVTINVLRQIR